MRQRSSNRGSTSTTEAGWALLRGVSKSILSRPQIWLLAIWLSAWALFAWHIVHPSSWDSFWGMVNDTIPPLQGGREGQLGTSWIHELGIWAQAALFISTALLAVYVCYALWVWRRYKHHWMRAAREERLQGGRVLEILIPIGSKADARAASDMFGQLWNFLSNISSGRTPGTQGESGATVGSHSKVDAERLALSLEMWSTPQTNGKVCFYVWCPDILGRAARATGRVPGREKGGNSPIIDGVRHLILVHHPRCRVRWVDDPLKVSLRALVGRSEAPAVSGTARPPSHTPSTKVNTGPESPKVSRNVTVNTTSGSPSVSLAWLELGLLADSRYPIGSGYSDVRLLTNGSSRGGNRPGSPGAGSDPLASLIGILGSDEAVPILGIQIVVAARSQAAVRMQQAVNQELARLHDLEVQLGKKALGPQHEARVLALEEKADRQGYDVLIRLVAVERDNQVKWGERAARAETRLTSLANAFRQYDRTTAGVHQGLRVIRKAYADLNTPFSVSSGQAAPVLGRWHRAGVCLPQLLPFMKMGKPCILNRAELSVVYHFPHQGLESLTTLRLASYRQIPPPAYAHVTAEQLATGQRVVLGILDDDLPPSSSNEPASSPAPHGGGSASPGEMSSVSQARHMLPPGMRGVGTYPQDLRRGSYVFGPMGSGKSVFLYNTIVQYMSAGRGVGLVDGKGDSYEEVLKLVPAHMEGEVLAFDPENRRAGGGAGGRSIGINPLDGRLVALLGAEKVESMTMGLMRKMMGGNWDGAVLMQRFLRDSILAVLEAVPAPTMLNLWQWLKDDGKGGNEYRERLLNRIRNQLVRDFWQRQVPSMSAQQRSSMQNVLTRVDRYVKNDVRHLILHPYSTVNFQKIMDRGTIFVGRISPRLGEDQGFIGALLLNGFLTGAFARQSLQQEHRRDYLLVVDEFQNFVDTARADVERMLSMARGYRLGLMLAHQYTEQLPKEVLSAILKNVQTWVLFGLQADDARLFAGYMGLRAEDFQNLPPYHTYQRTIVGNEQTGVYSARPLPPPQPAYNPGAGGLRLPGSRALPGDTLVQDSTSGQAGKEIIEQARETMRSGWGATNRDKTIQLVRGSVEESEEARRARVLSLATELYRPAEEGDASVVDLLSLLDTRDFQLYRLARQRVLDRKERTTILARPSLVPDKARRIERLSALRWGAPSVEVEALIRVALRDGDAVDPGDDVQASTVTDDFGPPTAKVADE